MKPFPAIRSSDELPQLMTHIVVECANCVEMVPMQEGDDPVEWARQHRTVWPHHNRFRTFPIVNFSLAVDEPVKP